MSEQLEEKLEDELPLSRTKKKHQAKQIEQLAVQLVGLTDKQFGQLKLPDNVAYEAEQARITKGRSSLRRQLKHLAGMIRKTDDALASILEQLENLDQVSRGVKKQFRQLEQLRDRLCCADSFAGAFDEMMDLFPEIDRKSISRLARSVHQNEDKRAYREIFKRMRDELG